MFFVISGVGQALSGFLVDRVGARPVMFFALSSFAASGLVAGTAQGYGGLVVAAALAGLGNAPFHPVDFTILNKRVSPQRLGHGFAVHGISGNLGRTLAKMLHKRERIIGIDRRPFAGRPKDVEMHQMDLRKKKAEELFSKKRLGEGEINLDKDRLAQALQEEKKRKARSGEDDDRLGKRQKGQGGSYEVSQEELGEFCPDVAG